MNDIHPEAPAQAPESQRPRMLSLKALAALGFFAGGVLCTTVWSHIRTDAHLSALEGASGARTKDQRNATGVQGNTAEALTDALGRSVAVSVGAKTVARPHPRESELLPLGGAQRAPESAAPARAVPALAARSAAAPVVSARAPAAPAVAAIERQSSPASVAAVTEADFKSAAAEPNRAEMPRRKAHGLDKETARATAPAKRGGLPSFGEMERECSRATLLESMPPSYCSCDTGEFEQMECHVSASIVRGAVR